MYMVLAIFIVNISPIVHLIFETNFLLIVVVVFYILVIRGYKVMNAIEIPYSS